MSNSTTVVAKSKNIPSIYLIGEISRKIDQKLIGDEMFNIIISYLTERKMITESPYYGIYEEQSGWCFNDRKWGIWNKVIDSTFNVSIGYYVVCLEDGEETCEPYLLHETPHETSY